MIWLGVMYTDGTRIGHAFLEARLYTVAGKVHVNGDALCGRLFSDDRSGARVDVVCSFGSTEMRCDGCLAAQVPHDQRPAHPIAGCETCERAARSLLDGDAN